MVRTTPEGMIPDIPNDNRENDVIGARMTIAEQLCRIVSLSRFGANGQSGLDQRAWFLRN
jgi:hypothetical protein